MTGIIIIFLFIIGFCLLFSIEWDTFEKTLDNGFKEIEQKYTKKDKRDQDEEKYIFHNEEDDDNMEDNDNILLAENEEELEETLWM